MYMQNAIAFDFLIFSAHAWFLRSHCLRRSFLKSVFYLAIVWKKVSCSVVFFCFTLGNSSMCCSIVLSDEAELSHKYRRVVKSSFFVTSSFTH